MLISVILCTRNRASQLGHVLTSFLGLTHPDGATWEMIVVDNGSTDETPSVIESFSHLLPLRRVRCGRVHPRPGRVGARAGCF